MSNESFESLFESNLNPDNFKVGHVIHAAVLEVRPDRIVVNAGLKSDAFIDRSEFGELELNVGDMVEVVIETLENGYGETRLSHEKARRAAKWQELEGLHQDNETVQGRILERVKGGFTVSLDDVQAFLPGSLIDIKPVRDPSYLEDMDLDFKIIKMDKKRNNIVVSRRAVLEAESSSERLARIEELDEGQVLQGIVKNITDYGAFVDLGGADGLLHITDMAWKRVKHPSELMKVGDEITVKILKFDREKNRVSLGMKQLGEDPWVNISRRYPTGTRVFGRVTNVTDYGCFVEIEEGVEGLVHMSEMDWTNKNVHPSKVVQTGDETEVVVLEINEERRRISLGIKQCKENPWEVFAATTKEGDKVSGKIRSITDFGLFVGLDGEIDGLVHLSDLSWTESGETAVRNYKRGDEVHAVILTMDPERERISLGIKQLDEDPIADFIEGLAPSYTLEGSVTEVDQRKAIIDLGPATALLKASEYQHARTDDLSAEISVGEKLMVRIINPDRKNGKELMVSHKATLSKPKNISAEEAANTTLGDLLKEQMDDSAS